MNNEKKDVYFQILHPAHEKDPPKSNSVAPVFPAGSIGFLKAITPIGTKFQMADVMGPQSQTTMLMASPQTVRFGSISASKCRTDIKFALMYI